MADKNGSEKTVEIHDTEAVSELYRQLLVVNEHNDIDTDDEIEAAVSFEKLDKKSKKKLKRKTRNAGPPRCYVDCLFH